MLRAPAIVAGKSASMLSRILGRGSGLTYPGVVAERIHPTIVRELAATMSGGSTVITGTNGKTTTAKMLGDALVRGGRRVVRNESGSNLKQGIASTLVRAASIGGRVDGDLAVLEVDEATMPKVTADLAPRTICVTNLFRDQLDRYGDLASIGERIGVAIEAAGPARLILNADDPLVAGLAKHASGPVAYFGVADDSCARPLLSRGLNAASCPECGEPLEFRVGFYAHLGDWRCPNCGLTRPPLDFAAEELSLGASGSKFKFNVCGVGEPVQLGMPGLYNVYNALAAGACALSLGLMPAEIAASLGEFDPAFGRTEEFAVGGKRLVLLLAKNPIGAEQALAPALSDQSDGPIGIALNDNAADGTDISWIWDVDFEPLGASRRTIVVSGSRADDLALRLKYAGVEERRLQVRRSAAEAVEALVRSAIPGRPTHLLATYTAMLELRSVLVAGARDEFASLGRSLNRDAIRVG